jgi:hypothetical protein
MATERDFELLDDYLGSRLSATDRSSFERKLQADPDLRAELQFQQQLVSGIKTARAAELKSFLQNVPVPSGSTAGTVSGAAKLAVGAILAIVVASGIWYFTNESPTDEQKSETSKPSEIKDKSDASTKQEPPQVPNNVEADVKEEATPAEDQSKSEKSSNEKQNPAKQPVLDVFDPSTDVEENKGTGDEDSQSAKAAAGQPGSTIALQIESNNRKYTYHYQFKNETLFLYGAFEKNLYEILEFFNDDKSRTIFLYHKDSYFLLKEDNDKIKPLVPITDQALVKKLTEYRNK